MAAILALHAHPDDIETLGAGTLALLAAQGHRIVIATVTNGDCGSRVHGAKELAAIRFKEATAAAAVIGARYRCGGVPDLCVFNDDATRRLVTELIRAAAPDIVITASPVDYHPDHEATSALVRDACFSTSVPNYQTGPAAPLDAVPHLYFMDPIAGRDREGNKVPPAFAVDISSVFETKKRMLQAHESQGAWVARQHSSDLIAAMEAFSSRRGQEFGVAYAEGFRQYRHQPYPNTPALQDLLGAAVLVHA
jgi:LmbE family N-acetylglucosaminyl deacetylase